jgi:flagellar biosynthesis protein FlhG
MRLDTNGNTSKSEIWAIGGGKGGTGKSFLSANLGIFLAKQGKQVIMIDADLGGANLHTLLDIPYPEATLSDLLKGRIRRIQDALTATGVPNLRLISGAQDILEIANPKHSQKMRIIRQIQELDVDYIILDLGAGTSFNILDFFLIADQGLLTVLPEPSSIENVYRFIKSVFYRRFKRLAKEPAMRDIIAVAMDQKNELGIKTPHDLINQISRIDENTGRQLQGEIYGFKPKIVVNQIRSRDDITLGFSMRSSCSRYFGITVEYPGYIEFDDAVRQAGNKRRPLLLEYPNCNAVRGIEALGHNLMAHKHLTLDSFINGIQTEKTGVL